MKTKKKTKKRKKASAVVTVQRERGAKNEMVTHNLVTGEMVARGPRYCWEEGLTESDRIIREQGKKTMKKFRHKKMTPTTLRKLRSFAVKYANTQISTSDLLAGVNQDPAYDWYVEEWENVSVGANEEWDLNFHMGWGKHDHLYVVAYPCVLDKDGNFVKRIMDKDYRVINFRVVKKGHKITLVKTRKCTFP